MRGRKVNQVCPDRQLLSVYFDGELPSPWKEKMEAHIAACPACARRLEEYRRVCLAGEAAGLESARDRVWQKLEPCIGVDAYVPARAVRRGAAVWQRRVSIPFPAAAAAAAFFLIIAMAFLMVLRTTNTEGLSGMTLASEAELEEPGIIPIANMEDVLQYLGSNDNGEIIILRLPESRSFVNYGEPAIIKAADYSRNVSGRRRP